MSNPEGPRFESAGWGFFLVSWIVFAVPCIYIMYQNAYNDTSPMVYLGFGIFLAGGLAGVLTWIVNSILQARAERFYERERRKAKKKKRKRSG